MALAADEPLRRWAPCEYVVERDALARYVDAVGETCSLYRDADAARAAGYRDVVAPPMFAAVYCFPAMATAVLDPEVGIPVERMMHGGQRFDWDEPVCAGDRVVTEVRLTAVRKQLGLQFYILESSSHNQLGQPTVTGRWTHVVAGGAPA